MRYSSESWLKSSEPNSCRKDTNSRDPICCPTAIDGWPFSPPVARISKISRSSASRDRIGERRREISDGEAAGALGEIQPLAFAQLIDRLVEDDQRQHIRFVERRLARQPHLRLPRGAADVDDRGDAGNDALRVDLQRGIDRPRALEPNLAVAQHFEPAPLEIVEAPHDRDGADDVRLSGRRLANLQLAADGDVHVAKADARKARVHVAAAQAGDRRAAAARTSMVAVS